jgi:hypothetical protein
MSHYGLEREFATNAANLRNVACDGLSGEIVGLMTQLETVPSSIRLKSSGHRE